MSTMHSSLQHWLGSNKQDAIVSVLIHLHVTDTVESTLKAVLDPIPGEHPFKAEFIPRLDAALVETTGFVVEQMSKHPDVRLIVLSE
jgi:hypothetical protein